MGLFTEKMLEYRGKKDPSGGEIDAYLIAPKGIDNPSLRIFFKSDMQDEFGVTVEEVLAIVYARLYELNDQVPCRENSIALTKIEEAGMWLDQRTADRINRGVEKTKEK